MNMPEIPFLFECSKMFEAFMDYVEEKMAEHAEQKQRNIKRKIRIATNKGHYRKAQQLLRKVQYED